MVGLVFGVIFGLTFTAYNWSRFHPWITLGIGLAYVLIFGLLNALAYRPEREKRVVSEAVKLRKYIMRDVLKVMLNGLLTGVVTIGCDAILSSPMDRTYLASPFLVLASALNISLFGSVLFLLISGLVGKLTESIQPAEVIAWSWTNMGWNFLKFLLIGFWGGVLISPLYQVAYAIYTGQLSKTDPPGILLNILSIMINGGWLIAATFGILGGFIGGFTGGLSSSMGDDSNLVKPNQGIIRSAKNGLIVGLIIYLTFVILAQIVFIGRITDLSIMVVTLLFGLMIGIIGGLRSGGTAYAQHTLLRLLLWQTKCVPWHYAHFLDYAVAHILLQRVGGGYIFVHRLLLEYFVPPNVVSLSNTQPLSLRQTFSPSQGELVLGPCTSQTIASVLSTQKNRPDVARRRIALLALTGITGCTSLGGIVTWSRLHQPLYSSIQRSFPTTRVMWSSNGNYIASTETNPNGLTARIWSSDNGQLIYSAPGLSSVDSAIAWSPADSRIVWITSKGMIKILDVANTAHILTYAEGTSSIACLAWSPDSRYIAIGYEHGVVQIRSTIKATHDLAYQIVATEKNGDKIAAITWSPDGKHLATFNNHATLKIWDALNGSHRATYTHHQVWPPTMRWSLDGRYLAWIADEVMKVWSGVEENHLSSYPLENGDLITAMAWAPDSKQVVLGSSRGIVQVWEVATWRLAYTYRQHGGSVSSVGWSLDGKYIASGSSDGTVQVWNVKGDLVRFYWTPGGPSGVGHVEWSPDGKRIVSGYHDGSMRVWRVF